MQLARAEPDDILARLTTGHAIQRGCSRCYCRGPSEAPAKEPADIVAPSQTAHAGDLRAVSAEFLTKSTSVMLSDPRRHGVRSARGKMVRVPNVARIRLQ